MGIMEKKTETTILGLYISYHIRVVSILFYIKQNPIIRINGN